MDGALGKGMDPYASSICKALRKHWDVPFQICSLWGGIIPNPRFVMICGSGELAAMGGERGNKSLWKIVSETCSALQLMKILGCLISCQKKGPLDP